MSSSADSFGILDAPPGDALGDLAALAAHICDAPISVVNLIDAEGNWVTSGDAFDVSDISRELCADAPSAPAVLEISDTWLDPRFSSHPMVIGEPHLRFYVGAPLVSAGRQALGALCVMDLKPRTLSAVQRRHLRVVANQVLGHLEIRCLARQFAPEFSARLAADAALREQLRMLDGVLKHTDVLVYAKDVGGRFVMVNPALENTTQIDGGLIGRTDRDLFDAELAEVFRRNDKHIIATRKWQVFSEDLVHPDGSVHTYRSTKFPLIDESGEVIGMGGVSTDVTGLAAARAAHAEAEERWRTLVEQSQAAVIVIDADGTLVYVNPEAITLCGAAAADQIECLPIMNLVPANIRRATRAVFTEILSGGPAIRGRRGVLRRLDGIEITVEVNATVVNHADRKSIHLELRDVTAVAAAHAALKQSASTDPLTGLFNKRAWDARVESLMSDVRYGGTPMTVAVIDLDNFKAYNDAHGHTAGDVLLQRFTAVAGAALRHDDVFARWGGEEFLIAMLDTTPHNAERILNRVRDSVPAEQTCSIGYTAHVRTESLAETVIRADKALYQAKSRGRNQLSLL